MTFATQQPGGALVPAGSPVGGGARPAAPGLHTAPSQAGVGNEGSLRMRRSTNLRTYGGFRGGTVDPAAWGRLMQLPDADLHALRVAAVREIRPA